MLLHKERREIRQQSVQVIDIIGHVHNALVLQEANKTSDLTGEAGPVGLMQGKAPAVTPMLLELLDHSVIDGRNRDALLLDPE